MANLDSMAERKYVHKLLRETGESILRKQTEVIDEYRLLFTGEMRKQRRWDTREIGDAGADLEIHYLKYLRFLDMKTLRGQRKAKVYHLYNRVLFGHLAGLRRKLLFGYTEDVKRAIIKEITM